MRICQKSATSKEPSNTRLNPYNPSVKAQMVSLYNFLSEKDKRLYAAAEAIKLPYGGIIYIANLFGCDRKTISRGIVELKNPELIEKDRDRKKGGGRKLSINTIPCINEAFLAVVYNYTAGDPMDERIRWTNLTHQQIADKLKEEGIEVSKKIVKQLFKKHGYVETCTGMESFILIIGLPASRYMMSSKIRLI